MTRATESKYSCLRPKRAAFSALAVALLAIGAAHSINAQAATLSDLELHGYLRAGIRENSGDTNNTCYANYGPTSLSGGNEFRIGNECGDYGELYFTAWQLHGKEATDEFFKTNVTFNFFRPATGWVETSGIGLFEAYVDSGNFFNSPVKYWAGKRVYRDASIFMNDIFYFANINGNGVGIYDAPMPTGKLAVAFFLTQSNPASLDGNGGAHDYTLKENLLDVRWTDIVLADHHKLDFWGAYAQTRGGTVDGNVTTVGPTGTITNSSVPVEYQGTNGYAVGLKEKYDFANGSLNALSFQYGAKMLDSLQLPDVILAETRNPAAGASLVDDKHRFRVVEDLVYQVTDHDSFEFETQLEKFDGTNALDKGTWWNIGTTPMHFFNQHFGVFGQFGFSTVKFDSDSNASLLKRATVGPLLALSPKYFARPQIRAFYTTSFERGSAYGAQAEVWF